MTRIARSLRLARSYALLAGAALRAPRPRPISKEGRLAMIPCAGAPVGEPVAIRWSDAHVPFVEARSDRDCAVGLGVVHAHLRWTQMEILRRVAWGRVAEMAGPAAVEVDRALRTLGIVAAVPGILAAMPADVRDWLDGFVDGINHVVREAPADPPDFAPLGLAREPWTAADVMAVGRAAVADVNWLVWLRLLPLRGDPGWPDLWERLIENGAGAIANLSGADLPGLLATALGAARKGSNAWAVAPKASASGAALLAGDPHLPITWPNVWLAGGFGSPSYRCVGFMLPGLPFVAFGRNRRIAWGGTAPHTASSDLFDLSGRPDEPMETRRETIRVRGGRPVEIEIRTSRYGPVVSDAAPMGGTFALRWIGHEPSDELSAMLAINRAGSFAEFRAATEGMAAPGQNWVVADVAGVVGKQIAAKLPARPHAPLADVVVAPEALAAWDRFVTAADFPPEVDPPRGFVVSANDRPAEAPTPLSYFYSAPDRAERIAAVLAAATPVTLDAMAALQRDATLPTALPLRDRLLALLKEAGEAQPARGGPSREAVLSARGEVAPLLVDWDGTYGPESRGALAFELLVAHVVARRHSKAERAFYGALFTARTLIARDLAAPHAALVPAVAEAVVATARELRRRRGWGDLHRLRLAHPLGALPGLGRRFVLADLPVGGTSDTVMKTAHPAVARRHRAFYGSIARFLADLADEDRSSGVLLGGQDGWLGSAAALDQLPLWRAGESLPLPLSEKGVRERHRRLTELAPP